MISLQILTLVRFCSVANHGRQWRPAALSVRHIIPDGPPTVTAAIPIQFWQDAWTVHNSLPAGLPLVTATSPDLRQPSDRLFEALGSNNNARNFILLHNKIHVVKSRIERYSLPMSPERFTTYLDLAVTGAGDRAATQMLMEPLCNTIGVFQYLNSEEVATRMNRIVANMLSQLELIERHTTGSKGLSAHWREFYPHYFGNVSQFARNYVRSSVSEARDAFGTSTASNRETVLQELDEFDAQIEMMNYPFEDYIY